MNDLNNTFFLNANIENRKVAIQDNKKINMYDIDKNTIIFNICLFKMHNLEFLKTEANNFIAKLTIITPKTKEVKEIYGTLVENSKFAVFTFKLSEEFTNQIGIYKCELLIKDNLNQLTCDYFIYEVKGSIVSNEDDIIEPEKIEMTMTLYDTETQEEKEVIVQVSKNDLILEEVAK